MAVDRQANQQQIIQAVLDTTAQALKVVTVSGGGSSYDTGAGVVTANTLRNTPASDSPHLLATRHEAAATPLSGRLSDGSAFYVGAKTGQLPSAVGQQLSANSLSVVMASDATDVPLTFTRNGSATLVTLDTSTATNNRPLPMVLLAGDSLAPIALGSGADSALTLRATLSTRHEAAATPLSIRLSNGSSFISTLPIDQKGKTVITTVRNAYASVNVTTGAWVELVASLGSDVNLLQLVDTSGQTLELGTGAAAAETRLILIPPGASGSIPVSVASGTRVSIRAVSGTASTGEIDLNFLS